MDEERFDPILLSIAQNIGQNHGGIDELLDVFLGFLRRKTDAFNPPGGFPQLETSFVAALKRQYDIGQRSLAAKKSAAPAGTKRRAEAPAVPAPAKAEVPIIEMSADGSFDATVVPRAAPAAAVSAPPVPAPVTVLHPAAAPAVPAEPAATEVAAPGSAAASAAPAGGAGGAEEDAPPRGLPGNGGSTDRYSWSQTLDDLQVALPLPAGTRAKDIVCDIKAKAIKARGGGRAVAYDVPSSSLPPSLPACLPAPTLAR